jgi:hypothetical protein
MPDRGIAELIEIRDIEICGGDLVPCLAPHFQSQPIPPDVVLS